MFKSLHGNEVRLWRKTVFQQSLESPNIFALQPMKVSSVIDRSHSELHIFNIFKIIFNIFKLIFIILNFHSIYSNLYSIYSNFHSIYSNLYSIYSNFHSIYLNFFSIYLNLFSIYSNLIQYIQTKFNISNLWRTKLFIYIYIYIYIYDCIHTLRSVLV